MSELATEIAIARYGLSRRFQVLSDCMKKEDCDDFLEARDAYFKYVKNSLIIEKILEEDLLKELVPSEDLPDEERWSLDSRTKDEINKEFDFIIKVNDVLIKGLDEALSFADKSGLNDYSALAPKQSKQSVSKSVSKKDIKNSEKIWYISIVKETNRTNRFIIINKNYTEAIEVKGLNFSKCIIALAEAILNKTKILEIEDKKRCKDYLNKNSGCRIYKSHNGKFQKYHLTDIVALEKTFSEGEKLRITNSIKSEVITYAQYKKRLNNHNANKQT